MAATLGATVYYVNRIDSRSADRAREACEDRAFSRRVTNADQRTQALLLQTSLRGTEGLLTPRERADLRRIAAMRAAIIAQTSVELRC